MSQEELRDVGESAALVEGYRHHRTYQSIPVFSDGNDEPPDYPGVINVVPDANAHCRWNHVEDLDSFFRRVYWYHQKHGFWCMVLQEFLELVQFVFVIVFTIFLRQCVDYKVLFRDKTAPGHNATDKISLSDAFLPADQCLTDFSGLTILVLFVATTFWILFFVRFVCNVVYYWEIARFYTSALKISLADLDNMTWHEVQRRLREVQEDLHLCVHKAALSELDVYNRILRFENYFIAMMNKHVLSLKFALPFVGELVFFTRGLKYNLELILFRAYGAPFENNWHLRQDFKSSGRRVELAQSLSRRVLWFAVGNLVLSPLIFLWQIMYSIFHYTELVKKDPSFLGVRKWSAYGKVYLRHFNELEHELSARLSRGYLPASKYMSSFTSPLLTVIAKKAVFFFGAPLAVLIILTIIDEDVLTAEHALTAMTVLGGVVALSRAVVPDENMVWCPEMLMNSILAQVHYLPDSWAGKAHTSYVRDEFSQLFQLKIVYVMEELLSPLVTPFMLLFKIRPQSQEIVDFLRNFTVDVVGVGDVCSFAQMDVKRHGSPTWRAEDPTGDGDSVGSDPSSDKELEEFSRNASGRAPKLQAENGKTELSLVHFALTNPDWRPPKMAGAFLRSLQRQAQRELALMHHHHDLGTASVLAQSLTTVSQMPYGFPSVVTPLAAGLTSFMRTTVPGSLGRIRQGPLRGGVSQIEGSLELEKHDAGLLTSVHEAHLQLYEDSLMGTSTGIPTFGGTGVTGKVSINADHSMEGSERRLGDASMATGGFVASQGLPHAVVDRIVEFNVANMSFSAVYLHEMHRRRVLGRRGSGRTPIPARPFQVIPEDELEASSGSCSGGPPGAPNAPYDTYREPSSVSVYYRPDRDPNP